MFFFFLIKLVTQSADAAPAPGCKNDRLNYMTALICVLSCIHRVNAVWRLDASNLLIYGDTIGLETSRPTIWVQVLELEMTGKYQMLYKALRQSR